MIGYKNENSAYGVKSSMYCKEDIISMKIHIIYRRNTFLYAMTVQQSLTGDGT